MFAKRILLGLAALLLCAQGFAASVASRSPFTQGHWWDPTRSGTGFEIFNSADRVSVVWFTYEESGAAVWFIAQGDLAELSKKAWPLLKTRWSDGHLGESSVVGSLRLNINHTESADVVWQIGAKEGTWKIQPFVASGVINEVDHSGSWFDPQHSGWGFGLTEQGDVLGGALFTYSSTGSPTWVAGFERGGNGSVEFYACNGACPWCAYRPPVTSSVGRLSFDFRSEMQLQVGGSIGLSMAPGVNVVGAELVMFSRPSSWRPADRQLANFDSESALKTFLDTGIQRVTLPPSVFLPSVEPSASFSTTNLQEAGVDEPDLVKTDGRAVYTFAYGINGWPVSVIRVAQVGDDGATLAVRGSVTLASASDSYFAKTGLFLADSTLVAVTGTQPSSYFGPLFGPISGSWMNGKTYIELLNTADSNLPVSRWRAEIDGHLVASRRIGQRLYVVSRFVPYLPGLVYGAENPASIAANLQLLANTPLAALLPKVKINGGTGTVVLSPSAIHAPPLGARGPMADMILVTAINLVEPRIEQTLAIVGTVETVYASSANLYLATTRSFYRDSAGALLPVQPPVVLTDIHQIQLASSSMNIMGSGSVEGYLGSDADKAAFHLSDYQGRLRVVTSSDNLWVSPNRNRMTVLEPSTKAPGLLKTVSYLPNPKRPQTLGKPNEQLYGTRFVGDRLYAVTFQRIDPLYVVDLSNATDPRIAGALEIPGFSDYLHPLPNGLLLGFGKDAVSANTWGDGQFSWFQGLQLSLYDVTDANQPRELQRLLMGKRGSESALLKSHHAFSMLATDDASSLIAIPAAIFDGAPYSGSGSTASYPWQESGLMRFELRGKSASDARLVQLPSLITHRPGAYNTATDASINGARSVLFRNGTIYVGKGLFWHLDSAGRVSGPF